MEQFKYAIIDEQGYIAVLLAEYEEAAVGEQVALPEDYNEDFRELYAYVDGEWTNSADKVRERRDTLLAECDWIVIKHTETGTNIPADWEIYRQALRDIPEQGGFPNSVTWPTKP